MKKHHLFIIPFIAIAIGAIFMMQPAHLYAENASKIAFPENYRNWKHVKSMTLLPGHPLADPFQGIHHIYANEKALEGYASGKFPDGSVLVFDLLKENNQNEAITEGPRKVVGVMSRSLKKYPQTDGWGYEAFKGNTKDRLVKDMLESCHGCHIGQSKSDFVFSKMRK